MAFKPHLFNYHYPSTNTGIVQYPSLIEKQRKQHNPNIIIVTIIDPSIHPSIIHRSITTTSFPPHVHLPHSKVHLRQRTRNPRRMLQTPPPHHGQPLPHSSRLLLLAMPTQNALLRLLRRTRPLHDLLWVEEVRRCWRVAVEGRIDVCLWCCRGDFR